jgi:uncharacterized protein YycO
MRSNKFRVYLFRPQGILGWIIALVTFCRYTHSAIEIVYEDGQCDIWDSNERRGEFGLADESILLRSHEVWEFEGDLTPWVEKFKGKKYDWAGVIGWIFKADSKSKFYCFESTWAGLMYYMGFDIDDLTYPDHLSGCTLKVLCQNLSMRDE